MAVVPLCEWMRACPLPHRPWLILGKGPSFADRRRFDLTQFNLVSLNHVVREQRVDVAHFIDLDALEKCADVLPTHANWLMVPRYPHVEFQPSDRPLEDLMTRSAVLRHFAERGRVVWYYHDLVSRPDLTNRYPADAAPIVRVDAFSAEAVVNVLAALGVKQVRTLGIDGGIHYSSAFRDLNGVTRLANGQESFDKQFIGINQTVKEFDMDYGPLAEPIRVFVGADETQRVAAQVLEYSIRRFATRPVEVMPMLNLPVPMPKDPANRPRTGFSFARFLIPSLAGYRGKAIYLDADMLVFGDIADLWDTPLGASKVLCTRQDKPPVTWQNNAHFQPGRQMSVMLIDCEKCQWKIDEIVCALDEGRYDYRHLMSDLCVVPHDEIGEHLDPMWNCLEHFEAGRTKLLHFTDMDMQPWRHQHNPLKSIWRAYYRAAVEAGAVDVNLVEKGITGGWLIPELADCLRFAPARLAEQGPALAALAGSPSVRQRSLELEAAALRAELGLVRLEAQILRHECYKQFVELGNVHSLTETLHAELARMKTYAAGLEDQVRSLIDLPKQVAGLQQQVAHLNGRLADMFASWTWKIGRAVTKPAGVVRKFRRPAA
jgi:Glycosyl transferase family 8